MERIKKIIDLYKNDRKEIWAICMVIGAILGYNTNGLDINDYMPSFENKNLEERIVKVEQSQNETAKVISDLKVNINKLLENPNIIPKTNEAKNVE